MPTQNEVVLDDQTRERFEDILFSTAELRTEHASCLIDFINGKNEQAQVELLTILLESFGIPGHANGKKFIGRKIDNEKYQSLARMLDEMIHGTMKLIIHSRRQPREAAQMLRDLIFGFVDPEQRDYCLAEIMSDDAVPYRPIPMSTIQSMTRERLARIAEYNIEPIAQIRAVLRAGIDTTIQAELILKIMESVKDFETKVGIFELCVLAYFNNKLQAATKRQ